ncbi:hypothetical protein [Nocardia sp. 852002-20019_SCH5090214]|uniref:hypothetical protein n=1 Tax=Nocardia sp. 852002-20019_SCH5090214 TaxID=1834087 RepID=UPI0012EAD0BF|nr:hypothetical protein [Nocardia sp. 852002-20019_SCH5090214]
MGGGALPPSSQKMNKSGTMSVTASTPTIVPTWTADAGYPATTITSNALVVDRAGTVNVTARMAISGNSFAATITGYIYLNGVQIKSATLATTGTITLDIAGVAVGAADTLDMRVAASFGSGNTLAAAGTYLQIDAA